jgi:hypothetical protein
MGDARGCQERLEGMTLVTDCGIQCDVSLYSSDPSGFRKLHIASHEVAGETVVHHEDIIERLYGDSMNGHSKN